MNFDKESKSIFLGGGGGGGILTKNPNLFFWGGGGGRDGALLLLQIFIKISWHNYIFIPDFFV